MDEVVFGSSDGGPSRARVADDADRERAAARCGRRSQAAHGDDNVRQSRIESNRCGHLIRTGAAAAAAVGRALASRDYRIVQTIHEHHGQPLYAATFSPFHVLEDGELFASVGGRQATVYSCHTTGLIRVVQVCDGVVVCPRRGRGRLSWCVSTATTTTRTTMMTNMT
jgi:hypothetical protein